MLIMPLVLRNNNSSSVYVLLLEAVDKKKSNYAITSAASPRQLYSVQF